MKPITPMQVELISLEASYRKLRAQGIPGSQLTDIKARINAIVSILNNNA